MLANYMAVLLVIQTILKKINRVFEVINIKKLKCKNILV